MFKSYKFRIYPTALQKELLDKHFGAVRLVFNLALETKSLAYSTHRKVISRYDLQVQLKDLKNECIWLNEINSQSLQVALLNLDAAYSNFFNGKCGFPSFKSKHGRQVFSCPQNVNIKDRKLYIAKFRNGIRIKYHRDVQGVIKSATITKDSTHKYYASILTDDGVAMSDKCVISNNLAVGLDLGIKTFATLSDGKQVESPKYLKKSLNRLKVLQRRLAKKNKGGANRLKAKLKLSTLSQKITNQRKDFLHKASTAIVKQYDTICIEDLAVKNMVKNHKLAQSIADASWGTFTIYLKYKSDLYGKNLIKIGRYEPSSKMHNECGFINKELTLNDRLWICGNCGKGVDRDLNAAINIKNIGLLKYSGGDVAEVPVELPTLVGTMKQEAY